MDVGAYIFLDPDGTRGVGLTVIVAASTGVIYAHQCGGITNNLREVEGFAVPLGDTEAARPLHTFFQPFKGTPPPTDSGLWSGEEIKRLQALVGSIPFWHTYCHGQNDSREFLALDMTRLGSLTEAWIPGPYSLRTGYPRLRQQRLAC